MYRATQSNFLPGGVLNWTRQVLILARKPAEGQQHKHKPVTIPVSRRRVA